MHWGGKAKKEAGTIAWGRPFWMMLQSICVSLPLGGRPAARRQPRAGVNNPPPADRPEPGLIIPPASNAGPRTPVAAEAAIPPLDWWRGFRSRELTEIIE